MIAERGKSAFAELSITCGIPENKFGKRLVDAQASSTEWDESDIPAIEKPEVLGLLKDQAIIISTGNPLNP
jgi:hypothetical protein